MLSVIATVAFISCWLILLFAKTVSIACERISLLKRLIDRVSLRKKNQKFFPENQFKVNQPLPALAALM